MGLVGGILILGILLLIVEAISAGVTILLIVALWKLFEKCHRKGWECLVPFYNTYVLCKISGAKMMWGYISMSTIIVMNIISAFMEVTDKQFNNELGTLISIGGIILLLAVLIVSLVASFIINKNLAERFGEGTSYGVALTLLPFIFFPIFAFSKKYVYHEAPTSN